MLTKTKSSLVSELVKSQTKVKQAEDKYRYLFNRLGDAIFVHDMNNNILDANYHACQRYGYSLEKFRTMKVKDVDIPDHAKHIKKRVETLLKNGIVIFESVHRDSNGMTFPVEATAKFGGYEGQKVVMVICHEITERKKAENELLKVKKLESLGVLAGGIAHDFNNILTGILGNIELAAIKIDKTSEAHHLLNEAKKASIRAKDLTQQLLTFSKGGDPVKKTSSISKVITDSANFVLHGSSAVCQFNIPYDLWKVDFDSGQISQVIQNIIINSSDAMSASGVIEVTCKNIIDANDVELSLPQQNFVEIDITDSGSGIPVEILDKIFDPFFSTKTDGSGLGLAICNSIIKKHDGYITVKSEINNGTTFSIFLPASISIEDNSVVTKEDSKINVTEAKIMIMDDELIIREITKQILTVFGHKVLLAENGTEAVDTYKKHLNIDQPIDIIIMDLTIPGGMGGKEAVSEILKINPKAKVIVSSGYSNDPVMANYKEYGFTASIAKPFQIEKMNKLINDVLSSE